MKVSKRSSLISVINNCQHGKMNRKTNHGSVTAQILRRNVDFTIQLFELQEMQVGGGAQPLQLDQILGADRLVSKIQTSLKKRM